MKVFVILASMISSCFVLAQQFKSGSDFVATPIYGVVNVTCHVSGEPMKTARFQCQDLRLFPAEYDYFLGPQNVVADSVKLIATQASGKQVEKSVNYADGISKSRVNLWIETLFQQPLLNVGDNKIDYILLKESQAVHSGQFTVRVTRGQSVNCPTGHILSQSAIDCDSPYSGCQKYFSQYNYCRN